MEGDIRKRASITQTKEYRRLDVRICGTQILFACGRFAFDAMIQHAHTHIPHELVQSYWLQHVTNSHEKRHIHVFETVLTVYVFSSLLFYTKRRFDVRHRHRHPHAISLWMEIPAVDWFGYFISTIFGVLSVACAFVQLLWCIAWWCISM